MAFLVEGSLILLAMLLGWLLGYPPLEHFPSGANLGRWLTSLGLGVVAAGPLVALLLVMLRWPNGPWRSLVQFVEQEVVVLFRGGTIVQFAIVSLLAGFGEELLFRGAIQDALSEGLGPVGGVLLTAVLFGVCHWLTAGYAFLAALIGLYLGVLQAYGEGNLFVPIVAHAAYDFLALLILLRFRKHS